MDELFGSSGIGTAPPDTIYSTPLFCDDSSKTNPTISNNPPTTLNNFQQPSRPEGAAVEEQPGTSAIQNPTTLTNRQRQTPSHFLEAYEAHAERRTAVLESLVRPDFERWQRLKERRRRSFERKLLTSMGTVVEELKKISNQQEEIIHLLQNKPQ